MMWVEFSIAPLGKSRQGIVEVAWTRDGTKSVRAEWTAIARLLAHRLKTIPSDWSRVVIRVRANYRPVPTPGAARRTPPPTSRKARSA